MRTKLVAMLACAALTGCAAFDDPYGLNRDNRFAEVAPEAPPPSYVGTWTGGTSLYLTTMRLQADGRGLLCSSMHTRESVGNVKYHSGMLYTQSGDRLTIRRDGDVLVIGFEDPSLPSYRLVPDPNLVEASPYCKSAMK